MFTARSQANSMDLYRAVSNMGGVDGGTEPFSLRERMMGGERYMRV